jgi:Flp pilus assembly protein TadG
MRRLLRRRSGRGQGLVEFALVFPLFVLILFGLIDIGRAVFAYNEITNAAREGTRVAIVNQDVPTIEDRIAGQATAVAANQCVFFLEADSTFNTCSKGTATPADECPTVPAVGCLAHVEVWTDFTPITPLLGTLIGPMTLTANSESAIEFVCPNPNISAWSTAANCPKQP